MSRIPTETLRPKNYVSRGDTRWYPTYLIERRDTPQRHVRPGDVGGHLTG